LKILISGASGFFGKHLTSHLSLLNYNFDTIGRSPINNIVSDFEHKQSISNTYTLVIHAAGKAHSVPNTKKEISDFFNINVIGTSNFLDGLTKTIPKQFVFISSVSVYGLVEGENINESYPLLADDPYGKSKIEAEILVKEWCKEHNVICTILRLPLLVGKNPPGNLGAMIRAIKKGYYFNISGGNAKKSMVLAEDVASCILKVAEVGGIYNLTDGFHPSFYELSKNISEKLGRSFVPNLPSFAANILSLLGDFFGARFPLNSKKLKKINSTLTFDDSKARFVFGWNPNSVLSNLEKIFSKNISYDTYL
jgi:nucleoside-diphosphate-sugar epimerase